MLGGTGHPKSKPKPFTIKTPFQRWYSSDIFLLPSTLFCWMGFFESKHVKYVFTSPGLAHLYKTSVKVGWASF